MVTDKASSLCSDRLVSPVLLYSHNLLPRAGQPPEQAAGEPDRGSRQLGLGPPPRPGSGLQGQGQSQPGGLSRQPGVDQHRQVPASQGPLSEEQEVHSPGGLLR